MGSKEGKEGEGERRGDGQEEEEEGGDSSDIRPKLGHKHTHTPATGWVHVCKLWLCLVQGLHQHLDYLPLHLPGGRTAKQAN